jgi:putative colanic acid biosysnthesis UDP-glucose lipid carrier transferase
MLFSRKIKRYYQSQALAFVFMITDIAMMWAAFRLTPMLFNKPKDDDYLTLYIIFILSWLISGLLANVYQIENLGKFRKLVKTSCVALVFHIFIVFIGLVSFNIQFYSPYFLFAITSVSFLLIIFAKFLLSKIYKHYKNLEFNRKNVIIVGYTERGKALRSFFKKNPALGYKFKGYFDDYFTQYDLNSDVRGTLEDVKSFCIREDIDEMYYTLPNNIEFVKSLSQFADDNFIHFALVQDAAGFRHRKIDARLYDNGRIPILTPRREPLRFFFNRQVKRVFDIIFSLGVILFVFPILFLIIAIAIKLDSKGPVFFRQLRTGRSGKPFVCFKFRTMRVNAEANDKQAEKNDRRITKVGNILRKTSMDELPQFLNVLIGDMSVVGPRPHMLKHTEEYSEIISEFKIRHFITSGITGYAQVKGYRGETKEKELMEKRVFLDNWYVENWSLTLDIKIVLLTVWNILKGEKNAH